MNNPGDYVPPQPVVKQPPSCWVIGGIGCLIIFILAVLAISLGLYQALHSKTGKEIMSGMGKVMSSAEKIPEAKVKITDLQGAIVRYKLKTGNYPKHLSDLYPDYLADRSDLHCSLDTNPDPRHVSFTYIRPPVNSPPSTVVLTIKWDTIMSIGPQTVDNGEVLSEDLAGDSVVTQYQNGKEITRQVLSQ